MQGEDTEASEFRSLFQNSQCKISGKFQRKKSRSMDVRDRKPCYLESSTSSQIRCVNVLMCNTITDEQERNSFYKELQKLKDELHTLSKGTNVQESSSITQDAIVIMLLV